MLSDIMPLTATTLRFHLVLAIWHGSKILSESRVLRGETTIPENAIACFTEELCLQKFLSMNTGGTFYVDDFPSKGCFLKNGNGFFGTGGTDEEMAEVVLTGILERIWCDTETAIPTSMPSNPLTERLTIMPTTEVPTLPPSNEPTANPTQKLVTKSPSQVPTKTPTSMPPKPSTAYAYPTTKPLTEENSTTVWTNLTLGIDIPSMEPTAKKVIDDSTGQSSAKPTQPTAKPVTGSPTREPTPVPTSAVPTSAVPISAVPMMASSSTITSTSPSQFSLPLPITEHTIEMEYQTKPMTSLNNDSKIPSFAPIARPSSSFSYNNTDSVDSHLPEYDDPPVTNQLILIGVVFIVGFLLVAIYVMKTQYGRRILRNQTNPDDDDDDDLEEPAAGTDFPRYVDIQSNIEDQKEPLETEPLETSIEKAIEDSPLYNSPCIFFGDWHRAMQPSSNKSPITALVDDTTTSWNQPIQSPLNESDESKANWQRSALSANDLFADEALVDDASTFSEESSVGLSKTFSVFPRQLSDDALDEYSK